LSQTENRVSVELVLWRLPVSLAGSNHWLQIPTGVCVDGVGVLPLPTHESGKGDHKSMWAMWKRPNVFESPSRLLADFWRNVDLWRAQHE